MMKLKSLVCLAVFSLITTFMLTVEAAPDSIFRPILGEIQRQLPKGWVMRLPSRVYLTDYQGKRVQVYPEVSFYNSNQTFWLALNSQPNCQVRACYFTNIRVSKKDNGYSSTLSEPIFTTQELLRLDRIRQRDYETWTQAELELIRKSDMAILVREKITLANGIQGYYVVRRGGGASTPPSGNVLWQQDGFFFRVSGAGGLDEQYQVIERWKTELINLARSMATEPPIHSTRR